MATMPVTGYCTFHTTREMRYRGRAVRVQLWERRLSGSARRTQVAVGAPPIPAIRLQSRMMLCIEPRPSLRSEDRVGIPSQGQRGLYFWLFSKHRGGRGSRRAALEPTLAQQELRPTAYFYPEVIRR